MTVMVNLNIDFYVNVLTANFIDDALYWTELTSIVVSEWLMNNQLI